MVKQKKKRKRENIRNWNKYFTTADYNKFMGETLDAKIRQKRN